MSTLLIQSLKPFFAEITIFFFAVVILIIGTLEKKNIKKNFVNINYFLALIALLIGLFFVFNNFTNNFYNHSVLIQQNSSASQNNTEVVNNSSSFNSHIISSAIKNNSANNIIKIITIIITFLIIINNFNFIKQISQSHSEFLSLILIAVVGGFIMISAQNFLVFYLGLELQTLSLYLIASINKKAYQPKLQTDLEIIENKMASEAGMKYFILGSVASALLLFGISLIYGYSGTIDFDSLTNIATKTTLHSLGILIGGVLILTAMFFKIASAPFYMWSPDVYQGSNTTTTNFFASTIKTFTIFATLKIVTILFYSWAEINQIFIAVGLFSIILGSFATMKQHNLKRFFAYSSISHVGFILIAIGSYNHQVQNITNIMQIVIFYLTIYSMITFSSFLIINSCNSNKYSQNFLNFNQLAGLAKTQPFVAFCFAILMLSNAGIPPLAGFFAKFLVIISLLEQKLTILAIVAIIFTVISAFYYLRIIKSCYFDKPHDSTIAFSLTTINKITLFLIVILNITIVFGFNYFYSFISKLLQI